MGSITPFPTPERGHVRLEIDWSSHPHSTKSFIYRVRAGVATLIREGDLLPLSGSRACVYDTEAPLDVPIRYRSVTPMNANGDMQLGVEEWTDTTNSGSIGTISQTSDYFVPGRATKSLKLVQPTSQSVLRAVSEFIPIFDNHMNSNPYFETNATNWTGNNGATVARSTAQFHEGAASLLITPDGVTSTPQAVSEEVAVVAGNSYGVSAWLRIASAGSASRNVSIFWYNSSHVFLSSSDITSSPSPGTWALYTNSFTAPVGAAFARFATNGPGVLAAANTWNIDEAVLVDPANARTYTLTGQTMVPTNWTGGVGVQIFWYGPSNTVISNSGSLDNLWPEVGVWVPDTVAATPPPGATQMRIAAGIAGTPPPGFAMYVGEMYVTEALSTVETADIILLGEGLGWWKDPLHPANNIQLLFDLDTTCPISAGVAFVGIGDRQRPAESVLLEVPDSPEGIGVFGRRKAKRSSIRVASATYADADAIAALHASGAPLLLQLPAQYGEPDFYALYAELTSGRIATDQTVTVQVHGAPYALVRPPVGTPDGVGGTRYSDLTRYATYAAATAASVTWFDACQGELAG